MISRDDRLFCMLNCIDEGIKTSRLVCYMYVYQICGLSLNYRYKAGISNLKSERFNTFLNESVNEGYINVKKCNITITESGREMLTSFVFSLDELEYLENIKESLDRLTDEELYFIVLTDILISEVKHQSGVSGLVKNKEKIKHTLSQLTSNYTEERFDSSIGFLKVLKGGF